MNLIPVNENSNALELKELDAYDRLYILEAVFNEALNYIAFIQKNNSVISEVESIEEAMGWDNIKNLYSKFRINENWTYRAQEDYTPDPAPYPDFSINSFRDASILRAMREHNELFKNLLYSILQQIHAGFGETFEVSDELMHEIAKTFFIAMLENLNSNKSLDSLWGIKN